MDSKKVTKILKAIANERRLLIVRYLRAAHSAPVWRIAQKLNLSVKSTSKHLLLLDAARITTREQQGLEVFYRLHKPMNPIIKACI
jgi:DNA-binding transcriptional ArsR family regulator